MATVETIARLTHEVRTSATVRQQIARGELHADSLRPADKQALVALARRLQEGKGLPERVTANSSELYWM